jgi:Tetratricopeptide Repeats-Sensor/Adenylate and Guanylate cyclase catalytic domain
MTPGEACESIRAHLARGAPWDACDAFREAIAITPDDAELLYWGALAHARAGAGSRAHALLDQAQASPHSSSRLADILSLRGRLWKDAFARASEPAAAAALAKRARDEYLAAYVQAQDPYPGINAATLSMLLGEADAARQLATAIAARLPAPTGSTTGWDHATAGETALLLGAFDRARERYAAARALTAHDAGAIATMRRQVILLARVIPRAAEVLEVLPAADVLAFAGHLIDTPERAAPRFPTALAPAVSAAISARLARMHLPVVYTSAACGADLIFVEAALDIGAEVNVVLPFDREDFLRTSVAPGGESWTRRFEHAISRATRVIMATEERYLDDDILFEHAAMLVEGLCVLRAAQLETSPALLCVVDSAAPGRVGGTLASCERWIRHVGTPELIELQPIRRRFDAELQAAGGAATAAGGAGSGGTRPAPQAVALGARPQRTVKTLLFADFAGYSRLHDEFAPLFQQRFLEIGAQQIAAAGVKPLEAKTWGDALYIVFESPHEGAEFALGLLARMLSVDWRATGLPAESQIRVGLHAGPVFRSFDPVMGREGHFGSGVTKAARIEPVTQPGMVYVSEAFAATLAATGQGDYALEYVGRLPLAKNYGESRIYRLERRRAADDAERSSVAPAQAQDNTLGMRDWIAPR